MVEKLQEEYDYFCTYKCEYSGGQIEPDDDIYPCEYCQIKEFIRLVENEL